MVNKVIRNLATVLFLVMAATACRPAFAQFGWGYDSYAQEGYSQQRYAPQNYAQQEPPIEIFLGQQMGRWGDYYFNALGGMRSHPTPKGSFRVRTKSKDFYSRKYKAPMPYSVFFTDQCAIHVGSLRVKSHGCIHVDWPTGQMLFNNSRTGKTKVIVYD